MEARELTIAEAAAEIAAHRLSPLELFDSVVDQIERVEPRVGAFDVLNLDLAWEAAQEATRRLAHGQPHSPLCGIPVGIKSLIDRQDVECTSSSATRSGRVAVADAPVVASLRREGAVMVGQTHTHEYAYGCTTPSTRNPWNLDCIPGGSSGGSAAAVAGRMSLGALGTDTAGSIRIPSALCGVSGLKPTYGRVSSSGVTPLSWSLDHVGPIARTAIDVALLFGAIDSGQRGRRRPPEGAHPGSFTTQGQIDLHGLVVGLPTNYFFDQVESEIEHAVLDAISVLVGLGATVRDVTVPHADLYMPTGRTILMSEASAWHQAMLRGSGELYGPDVRIMLEAGELMLATDYINAQRARSVLKTTWQEMFAGVDVVLGPTVPAVAVPRDQDHLTWADGVAEPVSDAYVRLTAPSNLTGMPSLSVPCGLTGDGLPVGLQIIGRPWEDWTVLAIGRAFQEATTWHLTGPSFTHAGSPSQ
jgi:aspartyl-tRNA(Asn)/glutamyl-tRNA(Gln) amidotransferase subunit A